MRLNSACPIPRRRCELSTCMSAHHVARDASTLRTRPTMSSPSSATYWRNGASSVSKSIAIGRVRVAFPSRAARSAVRTRSMRTGDGGSAAAGRSLPSPAIDSPATCRRREPAHPAHPRRPLHTRRTVLASAVARWHPLSSRRRRAQSTPPCDSREHSGAVHPASPTKARHGWLRRERCGSCRRCARARTPQSRIAIPAAVHRGRVPWSLQDRRVRGEERHAAQRKPQRPIWIARYWHKYLQTKFFTTLSGFSELAEGS